MKRSESKTLLAVAFMLLLLCLCSATRRTPSAVGAKNEGKAKGVQVEESCYGIVDEDECLMRRTLNAHLDYIYTQHHSKP